MEFEGGRPKAHYKHRMLMMLDEFPSLGKLVPELSGGETARAGLATALATDPLILVADEPTAEVDRETESRLVGHFEARRNAGLATLIATHSRALAGCADRIVSLKDGKIDNG